MPGYQGLLCIFYLLLSAWLFVADSFGLQARIHVFMCGCPLVKSALSHPFVDLTGLCYVAGPVWISACTAGFHQTPFAR